jgi:CRISPR/Cas system-associated protein Cas7 (RAMP superfamily)
MELVITSGGQDFRPIDVIPLSTGFGEQRLHQRETQSAVYVYPGDIDVDHPLTVSFQGQQSVLWEQVLQRIERERALVKARATRGGS